MKLYDFKCATCSREFEELVADLADARCPSCGGSDVDKQLSAFNVGKGGGSASPGPSGGCGGGMCGGGGCGLN